MLLHIGGDISIYKKDIIAIYDLQSIDSVITNEFFQFLANRSKIIETAKEQKNKSIVFLEDKIYFSPISSSTLHKRAADDTVFE